MILFMGDVRKHIASFQNTYYRTESSGNISMNAGISNTAIYARIYVLKLFRTKKLGLNIR